MTVSVMIATKGRLVDLRVSLRALQQLNPMPLEALITLDGCAEEVVAAVKVELPEARLFVNQIGLGSVASRDRMMREARGDLVLALDDDSYPEQPDCIARIVPSFEQHPKLAVLHFPQRTDEYPETLAQTVLEHSDAMSFSVCSRNSRLARFLAVSLRVETRLVMGHSRTALVVAGGGWNSVLSSKAHACFMDELQTLAEFVLNFPLIKRVSWPNL